MFGASAAPSLALGPAYGIAASVARAATISAATVADASTVKVYPQSAVVATMLAVSPPATGETMAAFDSFDSKHGKAVGRHDNRAGAEDVPPKSAVLDLSSIGKPLSVYDIPIGPTKNMIDPGGFMPAQIFIKQNKGAGAESDANLCLDLTGSEPYYNATRRKLNLAGRTRMHVDTIEAVGNALQQGLRGPYARWSVTRHAQKTRHARDPDLGGRIGGMRGALAVPRSCGLRPCFPPYESGRRNYDGSLCCAFFLQ
jgi:hypothetical protein